MKTQIQELEQIAEEIRKARNQLAREVREGGKQSKEGFEKVLRAAQKMHSLLFSIPEQLLRIVRNLEEAREKEGINR